MLKEAMLNEISKPQEVWCWSNKLHEEMILFLCISISFYTSTVNYIVRETIQVMKYPCTSVPKHEMHSNFFTLNVYLCNCSCFTINNGNGISVLEGIG